ncbi:grpE protein homolog 2, mitochondrial-like isoform X1 [Aristolochia californica]|uniref:grpE protein homolog 2, mitochondrial-like isoform X1 n=1 Tax=Aristolochia californica TaxID=171875 RepID=UPI0035DB6FDE
MASRVFSRFSRRGVGQFRLLATSVRSQLLPNLSNESKYLFESSNIFCQRAPLQLSQLHRSYIGRTIQGFRFSSSVSPQTSDKVLNHSADEQVTESGKISDNNSQGEKNTDPVSGAPEAQEQVEESGSKAEPEHSKTRSAKKRRGSPKRTAFSDSDKEEDLSVDDLVKLVVEKEELLKAKQKEVELMKDKALRSYAEMENVIERTKRESENLKKFAIQSFAKSFLDVADNLSRASSVGKDSLPKVEQSTDPAEGARRLKELLEGVEMTVKQLTEVFKKFGVEKYDPLDELFDPNRHHAVVQIPDPSKPPGTVAAVIKTGYTLHDRIIRPAEVVVVSQPDQAENESKQSPAA